MTGFFDRVYEIVSRIPHGRVASYGQIAAMLEHPRAARTVGWALHSLPGDLHLPWYRVVSSSGRISTTGFAEPSDLQRQLLAAEGVEFDAQGRVDMRRFGWDGGPIFPASPTRSYSAGASANSEDNEATTDER